MNISPGSLNGHLTGLVIFLGVLLVIAASNLLQLRRSATGAALDQDNAPGVRPRVSVLVPARNEARHIAACVRSLLEQDYPDFEVLVLDDQSRDGTGQIVAEISAERRQTNSTARLRSLEGRPPPPGWVGKNWACQQLSEVATGDLLLFTDADTRYRPHAIKQAVYLLQEGRYDLLTALPYQEVHTLGELLTVPSLYWSVIAFFPLWLAYRVPIPSLAVGIGQFMLFRRSAYQQAGGFLSIRDQGADDLALTRRVKALGMRWRLIDGGELVRCRMYQGFSEAFQGFSRSFFTAFGYRILPYLFIWSWIAVAFLEPPLLLFFSAASGRVTGDALRLAATATAQSLLLWTLVLWRFRFPVWSALLYPLHVSLAVGMAMNSLYLHLRGRATWKGRVLIHPRANWW